MPLFTQPGDRAIDGLIAGVGQLFAMLGWATVAVGVSAAPGFSPPLLLAPGAGLVVGMLYSRAWVPTLVAEVVLLSLCAALLPQAEDWVWTGAFILGIGRLATWYQMRKARSS